MQPHEKSELIAYLASMANRADEVPGGERPNNDLEYWVIGLDQAATANHIVVRPSDY